MFSLVVFGAARLVCVLAVLVGLVGLAFDLAGLVAVASAALAGAVFGTVLLYRLDFIGDPER